MVEIINKIIFELNLVNDYFLVNDVLSSIKFEGFGVKIKMNLLLNSNDFLYINSKKNNLKCDYQFSDSYTPLYIYATLVLFIFLIFKKKY